ncbi:FtsW/RodA/SpoVE family cell cycle protein [Enterococcus bulliens]
MPVKVKKRHLLDFSILIPYLILCIVGLMMVYSTTSYELLENNINPAKQAVLQFFFWVISLLLMAAIYRMKTTVLRNQRLSALVLACLTPLMFIVFAFPRVNGSFGWINIGIGTLQPAEFLKFVTIWFLASRIANRQPIIQHFESRVIYHTYHLVWPLFSIFVLALYPDYGNMMVLLLVVLMMLLGSGLNYLYALCAAGFMLVGSFIVIWLVPLLSGLLPSHVVNRFLIYRDPFSDEYGLGHQAVQGYYAMFNGGLFGRGLGNSIQKKGFLSEAQTDYAFAILVEELGLIVAILLLALLLYMIARIFLIGIRSSNPFNSLMCIGIGSLFLISIFINLGGITGVIPLTGITFPFVSQGGSSLLMFSVCIGFVLNISADEKKKRLQLI